MTRLKISIAVLAVLASGALINCSEFQGNHSTRPDGPELNSEAPQGNTEAQEEAQAYLQKMDYRNGITADLRRIADRRFVENECSAADQEALANQEEVINMGTQVHRAAPPLQRIKDHSQSVQHVQFAVSALVRMLREADNHHCAMNVAAEAAQFGIDGLMENPSINNDMNTSEAASQRFEDMVAKADHIRDGLLPLVGDLQNEINIDIREPWIAMATEYETYVESVNERIALLGQLIELVRASYQCSDDGTNCSAAELARGAIVVNTESDIQAARGALDSFQIQEPGDSRLTQSHVDILISHDNTLERRQISLTNIVRRIEQEQGATGTDNAAPAIPTESGTPF